MNKQHYTDEKKLHKIAATTREGAPFRVPDNYFDTLPERVMQRIRQQETEAKNKRMHRRRFWIHTTAAATLTAFFALTIANTHIWTPDTSDDTSALLAQDIEYTDELLDYAMLDNSDIEFYLTEAAY